MGLFLGMSIISLTEFGIYLAKISWIFISKRRREHMLDKKRRDDEREQHLQETLELAAKRKSQENRRGSDMSILSSYEGAIGGFGERVRRFAGSFRRGKGRVQPVNDMAAEYYYRDGPPIISNYSNSAPEKPPRSHLMVPGAANKAVSMSRRNSAGDVCTATEWLGHWRRDRSVATEEKWWR
jgi:hypothetical protein